MFYDLFLGFPSLVILHYTLYTFPFCQTAVKHTVLKGDIWEVESGWSLLFFVVSGVQQLNTSAAFWLHSREPEYKQHTVCFTRESLFCLSHMHTPTACTCDSSAPLKSFVSALDHIQGMLILH